MVQEIHKVGVVGLGTMGAGIVEVVARAGFAVTGVEVDDTALKRGRAHLERSLAKAVDKGKLSEEERAGILERVTFSTSREDLANADFAIEAVPERINIKRDVFVDLDRICPPGAILATNTSSLAVTEIAALTNRPGKVVGLHFFNPAPVMRLIEVVTTVVTEPGVAEVATEMAKRLGKTPVAVGDRAGFVANALLVPYLNHAVLLYERGVASREEIDAAIVEAAKLPMGPLALLDLVGLDVCLAVMDVLWEEFRTPRYAAAPLLRRMVAAGLLGRKTGRGFYVHSDARETAVQPVGDSARLPTPPGTPELADLLLAPHIDDALRMVGSGYATADDVDTAMRFGCGYPTGPIEMLDERGVASVAETLAKVHPELAPGAVPASSLLAALVAQGRQTLR
ncbi:3-hydroxybutyryl-CoA dehydrogenase [Marinactinospora thermotolerans DSM 45154]|uniref:3-hydroxybutyryl-CoA dehydrogenase n=1 Tax=Marinactinospora thermotolerans DSM 45154 TaxID=1122192 RepID=A0A1T4Q7V5_9ACTN|nr:3-hydroxybutyryl-CoA dehydrogenase [Marinactinospora thermotolerans]SJZ99842.1 3-hydroxybutyryl-CoA dehydrogenase [Marinactinospora thermotolerans DSM 45154]